MEGITVDGSWNFAETLMIQNNDTSSSTVAHKTYPLDFKLVSMFAGQLLLGRHLDLKHIQCDDES